MLLTAPSLSVSRRSCVFEKKRIASPFALHAGSCAPSVPASGSARSESSVRRHSVVVPARVATKTMCRSSGEIAASSGSSPEPSSAPDGAPSVSVSGGGGGGGTSRRCRTTGIERPTMARIRTLTIHFRIFGTTSSASARLPPSSPCRSRSHRVPARAGRRRSCPSSPRTGSTPSVRPLRR